MKITPSQRITIMKLWQRVCADRGWKVSDRNLRLKTFSDLVGRPLESTDDVGRIDECTKLMKGLETMLGISLRAAREADDTTINKARTLRYQIINELVPCLELYIQDVRGYMAGIMADKNRWWKIDRPNRQIEITDLDAAPIFRTGRDGKPREFPSQLEQLQYTLSARLNQKRKEAGHTVHDMRIKAQVPCHCAKCVSARNHVAQSAPVAGPGTVSLPVPEPCGHPCDAYLEGRPCRCNPEGPISELSAEEEAWWEQESQKEMTAAEREVFRPGDYDAD